MKNILLGIGLFLTFTLSAQVSSEKTLINHKNYIEILDSSAIDTTYAPLLIQKSNVYYIETRKGDKSGGIIIHFSDGVVSRAIELSHQEFNDFDDNDELRAWLIETIFNDSEEYSFYEFSDDTMNVDSTDRIVNISVDPIKLTSGDTIKISGTSLTIDGIASNTWDIVTGENAVNIGTNDAYIKQCDIIVIGEGRVMVVK